MACGRACNHGAGVAHDGWLNGPAGHRSWGPKGQRASEQPIASSSSVRTECVNYWSSATVFFSFFFLPTAAPVNVTRLHREAKWPEGHPKWHKTTAEWYKMKTKTCKITKRTQKNNHKGTKWHNTSRKRCKTTTIWLQRQTQLMQNYKVWGQREIQNDTIQPQKDASQPHGDITMRG